MKFLVIPVLIVTFHLTRAQSLLLIDSLTVDSPTSVSMDRAGFLYFADQRGVLNKYDPNGHKILDFSPPRPAKITLLEAWQGLRIFLFYQDLQEYSFLNRFLVQQGEFTFNPEITGFVELATPSFDNNIWIIDQTDFSLKKYDIVQKGLQSKTAFDLLLDPDNYDILHMKEHQNKLYISDLNSGILVFDNLGGYLNSIARPGIDFFNFWENEVYFIIENRLEIIDLYDKTVESIRLPQHRQWRFVLMYEDLIYLFADSQLAKYQRE